MIIKNVGPLRSYPNTWTQPQTLPLFDSGGESYNVKASLYGAKGDDATDDTVALQAALNAAGATKGVVLVPPGTYITNGLTVPAGVTIAGSGLGPATLKLKSGQSTNPNVVVALLTLGAASIVDSLILDGNIAGNSGMTSYSDSLVYIVANANAAIVQGCILQNMPATGILVQGATDAVIQDNTFTNVGVYSIYSVNQCHRLNVLSNRFSGSAGSAIKIHANDGVLANVGTSLDGLTIRGNSIDYRGQSVTSSQLAIELFTPTLLQILTITATGGTYTIEKAGGGGIITSNLAFNANAATIAAALQAAGYVATVTGSNPYTIAVNDVYLQVDTGNLTGGSASLVAIPPTSGIRYSIVSENQIWGPDAVGTTAIFGISFGGVVESVCINNIIEGSGIGIALEGAGTTNTIYKGNIVNGASGTAVVSFSQQNVGTQILDSQFININGYAIQLYGNFSGQNQSQTTDALIANNIFIDAGMNNLNFATIFCNETGARSSIVSNLFVIKDSPNPIRGLQVFAVNEGHTEGIRFSGNTARSDPQGNATHGHALVSVQNAYRMVITDNHADCRAPNNANGGIDGIGMSGNVNGHLIARNVVRSAYNSFNDTCSASGEVNRWYDNESYGPTSLDYVFPTNAVASGNRTASGWAIQQNTNPISRIGSTSITSGTSAPTSGTWAQGDICLNTLVISGGTTPEGWRCTVAGTPGTWTPMSNHP